jgi:hypothetical protein
MKRLTLALVSAVAFGFLAVAVKAADSAPVPVSITKPTPIETFAANGDIVAVSEAKVGARFSLVSVTGSQVIIQDAQGIHYRIDLSSTDYDPNKAVASTPAPPAQPSPARPAAPAPADNPFGSTVQTTPPPNQQAVN